MSAIILKKEMEKFCLTMIWICMTSLCVSPVHGFENEMDTMSNNQSCSKNFTTATGKIEFNYDTPDANCSWIIKPNVTAVKINLFLEKLQLDSGDVLTIMKNTSSGDFVQTFDPLHAQKDAVFLVSNESEIIVNLVTSSAKTLRHFSAMYASQACNFPIDDDILTVSQPIYATNMTDSVTCTYTYNYQPNITYAFHFNAFAMNKSTIQVKNVQEKADLLTGFDLPGDMLSIDSHPTEFHVTMDPSYPNDKFIIEKHNVYEACSGLMETETSEIITSPSPLPVLHNPKIPIECRWHLQNLDNKGAFQIKFESVNFSDPVDVLSLIDGRYFGANSFVQVTQLSEKTVLDMEIRTNSPDLMILFKPASFASQFKAEVSISGSGRYLQNNGTLTGSPLKNNPNGTVFLLEVPVGQNVMLNLNEVALSGPATLDVFEDFTSQSRKIASVESGALYPIISSTHKMMLKAVNFQLGEFRGEFHGIIPGCVHMSPSGTSDSYILSGSCNKVCEWIVPPVSSDDDFLLHFQYVNLEEGDHIQVLKLDKDKTVVADISYKTTTLPQFRLSPKDGAYINITRGACPAGKEEEVILIARSNYLPKCSKSHSLANLESLNLTSPDYPNMYPLLMNCELKVTRASPNLILHLSFKQLDLAPNHYINLTEIVAGKKDVVHQISGKLLPDDYVFTGDLVLQFVSNPPNSSHPVHSYVTGQGFAVDIRTTDCGGLSTNANATVTANKDLCIWKVDVPHNGTAQGSVNTLIYDTHEVNKSGNYNLDVYDGPSIRDGVISNGSHDGIWSRTNSLIFIYQRLNLSNPSTELQITYATKVCSPNMLCNNGLCMHPDWRCNNQNECGDFSDEHDCASFPVPTGQPPSDLRAGISPVTFGICSVVFLVLGGASVIVIPMLLERFRNRYHRMQDISVID